MMSLEDYHLRNCHIQQSVVFSSTYEDHVGALRWTNSEKEGRITGLKVLGGNVQGGRPNLNEK